jgi:hypothetical protein
MTTDERPRTTNDAPVLPFDYEPDDSPIWPCPDCYPWHVEVVTDPETGCPLVREWHAIGCPLWARDGA